MNIDEFVKNFASVLEETHANKLKPQTNFRNEIEEWSSFTAFSVIAMVGAEYNVTIRGEDIRNCHTIEDIFNIVKAKNEQ